jgi:hypothetical protein
MAHEVSNPVAANRDHFPGQVVDHPAATAARIRQVGSIAPGHDPKDPEQMQYATELRGQERHLGHMPF